MTPPGLVLFDCDGVLVDSEPAAFDVLLENLGRRGFETTKERLHDEFLGGTMTVIGDKLRSAGVDLPADWVDEIYTDLYARLRKGVNAIPGVTQVLDALDAAEIPYAVGSNGQMEKMEITLNASGLMPRLKGRLYSAQVIGRIKPAPDVYLTAANDFGLAPTQSVVIEDSKTGVIAAQAAGMRCFGYAPNATGAELAEHGAIVFHDMKDLPALLHIA